MFERIDIHKSSFNDQETQKDPIAVVVAGEVRPSMDGESGWTERKSV